MFGREADVPPFSVQVSYFEIYLDKIRDLLDGESVDLFLFGTE